MGKNQRLRVNLHAMHSQVTGSMFLGVANIPGEKKQVKFVIDVGLFQERRYEDLNQKFKFHANDLSFVVLTHPHMDHIGRVPMLVKQGFRNPIFCTRDTSLLMPEALFNAMKVMKKNSIIRHQPNLVLYEEEDINSAMNQVCPLELYETYQVHENIKITLLPNAHLVGAAMVLVDVYDCFDNHVKILFTGDYKTENVFLINQKIPKEILEDELNIVTEATYGATTTMEVESEKGTFEQNISYAIWHKKEIVIPVFALGRCQEILYKLKTMQDEHKIPKNIPIYLDGNLAIKYTEAYLSGCLRGVKSDMLDFLPANLEIVKTEQLRNSLLNSNRCKIIVTTSGMGKHGPAQVYIPHFVEKENALIHFVGYCTEGTYGRILQETKQNDELMLGGLLVTKKADVKFTGEFSSHAKADEMLEFLKKFKCPPFSVIINHGTTESKKKFASMVKQNIPAKKVGIIDEGTVFYIGPVGIEKTLSVLK